MDICVGVVFTGILIGLIVRQFNQRQKLIDAALHEWRELGHEVVYGPVVVMCYSTLPPRDDPRHGFGVLSVGNGNLLYRSYAGATEVIPLDNARIAAGDMWRRNLGGGKYGPHLVVAFEDWNRHETLAFHTRKNIELCQRHHIHYADIPRGYRVSNGRLITSGHQWR